MQKLILLVTVPLALSAIFLAADLAIAAQHGALTLSRIAGLFALSTSIPIACSFVLLRAVDAQLRAAQSRSLALEQKRVEYAAMMVHDMRTPLAQVCLLLGMLAEGEYDHDPVVRSGKIKKVLPEVTRLTRLIEDLLTFDKLQAGKLVLSREPSDLNGLMREVADALESESVSRGITLKIAKGPSADMLVDCDTHQIKRVLINLCSNALKYSRHGADVVLSAELVDAHFMRIEVWDEGPGIPDPQKELLFDFHAQGDDAMSKFGFGLGLSIARTIVEEHGGTIAIRDRDDLKNGAVVFFTLPVCPAIDESVT